MSYFLHLTNPFRPVLEKEARALTPGVSIWDVLTEEGLLVEGRRTSTYVVMLNEKPLLQADWHLPVAAGQVLMVTQLPRDGGGGGSNPLRIIMTVALIALAVWSGGAAAAAYGAATGVAAGTVTTGMAVVNAVVSAAVMITGTMLLNMVFPVKTDSLAVRKGEDTSPTYTFGDKGNQARLLQAIPVLYGRYRVYPDLIAQPYVEAQGNQQYIYQLFCITQGECEIESIMIGDEDVSAFGEVETQIINPGETVTLFPDNVFSSASIGGNILLAPGEAGYDYIGPYVVCPPEAVVDTIALDLSLPGGLVRIDDEGNNVSASVYFTFEYQAIDDEGQTLGPMTTLYSSSFTYSTQQPQMRTVKLSVPLGRYQVRGIRTSSKGGSRVSDALRWDALKGYIPSSHTYGNVTLLALVARATNNLNGSLARKISVVAKRKLPVWDPVSGWSEPVLTKNPAWAIADAINNPEYGRGLPDSYYNLQELYRLSNVWDTRGDEFNGVFDTTTQFWDSLSSLCAVGRAIPMYYAGMIDVVRNEPKVLPSRMFTPQNMIASSFSTRYLFAERDTPDHVVVEYVDDTTWQPASVSCILPGSPGLNPSTVSMIGISNRAQAWREGISLAAKNRDQRRLISFTTGLEGALTRYGEMVLVSHDVPGWGQFGRIEAFSIVSDGAAHFTTTEPLQFDEASTHYIAFRKRNGRQDGPYEVQEFSGASKNEYLVLGAKIDIEGIYISDGIREELTQYQFGPSERAGLKAIILNAQPARDGSVALSLVNYADSVHTAENGGAVPIPPPVSSLPGVPVMPTIDGITLQATAEVGSQVLSVTPTRGADYFVYQVSTNGIDWTTVESTAATSITVHLTPGTWYWRARAVGQVLGPWKTGSGEVQATTLPEPELEGLFATQDQLWAIQIDVVLAAGHAGIADYWELWASSTNDLNTASKVMELPFPATRFIMDNLAAGTEKFFWARVVDTAGRKGPWANAQVGVPGKASNDSSLLMSTLSGKISDTMLDQALRDHIDQGGNSGVAIQQIENDLAAMYMIKTQLTEGGRTALAGIGVGVENNAGILESQVLVLADRFAITRQTDVTGQASYPFVTDGPNTYIANAFIQNASIGSAKLSEWLESDALGPGGVPVLRMNFRTGEIQLNASVDGGGRMTLTNNLIQVYDANDQLRVRLGIWS